MGLRNVYDSEELARTAAKEALERVTVVHGKNKCRMNEVEGAVIITHPDLMQGVVSARYEW